MHPDLQKVQLNEVELIALADLIRVVVDLDDDTTPEEADDVALVARQVGEEAFWAALESSKKRSVSVANLKQYAAKISRRPAQELVYTLLDEVADADGLDDDQRTLLENLRHEWVIED